MEEKILHAGVIKISYVDVVRQPTMASRCGELSGAGAAEAILDET